MLRSIFLAIGGVLVATGLIMSLLGSGFSAYLGRQSIMLGVLLLILLLFERRFRKKINTSGTEWQTTGERFVDPTSGKLTEVRFNPSTGERAYIEMN